MLDYHVHTDKCCYSARLGYHINKLNYLVHTDILCYHGYGNKQDYHYIKLNYHVHIGRLCNINKFDYYSNKPECHVHTNIFYCGNKLQFCNSNMTIMF